MKGRHRCAVDMHLLPASTTDNSPILAHGQTACSTHLSISSRLVYLECLLACLTQGARVGALNRGCGAQLVFVLFLMAIPEVGATPGRPSAPSTTAVAGAVPGVIEDRGEYLRPSSPSGQTIRKTAQPRRKVDLATVVARLGYL